MEQNRHTVPGELHVNLRVIHPQRLGGKDGGKGVFHALNTSPVPDGQGPVNHRLLPACRHQPGC